MRYFKVLLLLCFAFTVSVTRAEETLEVNNVELVHAGDSVQFRASFVVADVQVGRNDVWLLVPHLVNGNDSIQFPSIGIYGKLPYYYILRNGLYLFQNDDDVMIPAADVREGVIVPYARSVPYSSWHEGASLRLDFIRIDCCGYIQDENVLTVLERQQVVVEPKIVNATDTLERGGQAHVDFIVNRTELLPEYHTNRKELGRISNLIDSVQADPQSRIDSITLHGYASPEGPYDNNVRLAKGRVKALAEYLAERHQLDSARLRQRFTPEDWAGLRRYVEQSSLPHRREILEIIDDNTRWPDPDEHLAVIKRRYPADYRVIAEKSLPYLRHTDYTIRFTHTSNKADTIPGYSYDRLPEGEALPATPPEVIKPLRPLFAAKTNLLFDLALWPNAELEIPLGRTARWSIMAEWGSPWYVWHHNSRAYQILNVGIEGRRWLGKCDGCRPVLTGGFVGAYACVGKYDLEWNSIGNQGEYVSAGFSGGYSWPLRKCLNLEVSGTFGAIVGKRRYYEGEFNDTHLIWKHFGSVFYAGPTQLKVSIVWLIPRKWFGLGE